MNVHEAKHLMEIRLRFSFIEINTLSLALIAEVVGLLVVPAILGATVIWLLHQNECKASTYLEVLTKI